MSFKSVAILDVRSMSVTAVIGEAGVNNTFVFKGSQTMVYDGYENGRFYSAENVKKSVYAALSATENSAGEHLKTIYVSVPGEFTKIITKKHLIAFNAPKRIAGGDIQTLFNDGYGNIEEDAFELVNSSALYFITADNRKVSNPTGIISSTLQANVCYIVAACYYTGLLRDILQEYGYKTVKFVPASYLQSSYLLSEETRNAGAILLDVGMLSTTVSVAYGNGILEEQTYWFGEGHIVAEFCARFNLSYDEAVELAKTVNLFGADEGVVALDDKQFSVKDVNETVKYGLDELCEPLTAFLENCTTLVANRPLLITGEGVTGIRGAAEHISRRLNREVEIVSPTLPYYNKPSMSSRISLLDFAVKNRKTDGFFYKLFKGFGGQ